MATNTEPIAAPAVKSSKARWYIYTIHIDGVCRYVGKGTKRRLGQHIRCVESILRRLEAGLPVKAEQPVHLRLAEAMAEGAHVEVRVLLGDLLEKEAEYLGDLTIMLAEREPTGGSLWNILDGGKGFTSDDRRRFWDDPSYRERMLGAVSLDERRARMKATARRLWGDPKHREHILRKRRSDEYRERMRATSRELWASEEHRAEMSAKARKQRRGYSAMTSQPDFTLPLVSVVAAAVVLIVLAVLFATL
jgi:hypothetical protein